MIRLCFDTSDTQLACGIANETTILYQKQFACWQRQSEFLMQEIQAACQHTGIQPTTIDEIIVGIGPGSYTGVRLSLSVAKILGVVAPLKIFAVSSLAIFGTMDENYIACMNARGGRSYFAIYEKGEQCISEGVYKNEEVLQWIKEYQAKGFALRGDVTYLNLIGEASKIVEGLFSYRAKTKAVEDILTLSPKYLKEVL